MKPGTPAVRGSRFVAGNVLALGLVSLVTDVSAEMVTAILPAYLVLGLHLSVAQYGLVDGLYTGVTALTRLAGGYVADRLRLRKLVAGLGYGLSAVAKFGYLLAGPHAALIGATLAVDRTGKGLRTAPRDALITLSVPPEQLGRAFGLHRTLDSLGAFAGPLVAMAVLAGSARSYDAVFVASFCAAAIGVLLLVLFVRDKRGVAAERPPLPWRLLRDAGFRRLCLAAVLLGAVTVGDGFVYLILQRRTDLPIVAFPLLAVGANLAYLLLAAPLGMLSDRIGRPVVILGGYVALVAVYLLLASPTGGWPLLVAVLLLYGAFYAATDGVLMAFAGPLLPENLRTSGLALLQTGQSLAYLVSSVAFGLAWQLRGPVAACLAAAVAVVIALPLGARWLRPGRPA